MSLRPLKLASSQPYCELKVESTYSGSPKFEDVEDAEVGLLLDDWHLQHWLPILFNTPSTPTYTTARHHSLAPTARPSPEPACGHQRVFLSGLGIEREGRRHSYALCSLFTAICVVKPFLKSPLPECVSCIGKVTKLPFLFNVHSKKLSERCVKMQHLNIHLFPTF